MAFLKPDFLVALRAAVASRPAAAAAYQAGDPRVLAGVDAMAAMLAMLSQQLDVAEAEPFLKARIGTVLADAALKGVLPLAKPARASITVTNPGTVPVTLAAGRGALDAKGRRYVVEGAATIPANGSALITAQQLTTRTITHTVAGSAPFYEVEVPKAEDDSELAGVDVEDALGAFVYTPDFCNVLAAQRVFHVETDEYRRVLLRFGAAVGGVDVMGHQPINGDVLTISVRECSGEVTLDAGSGFALEYVSNSDEAKLTLALASVLSAGAAPPSAEYLRMLARYPALHDSNAVFLSDFDFLLRRHMAGLRFLAVWNEQIEEAARGANLGNINKLFVSVFQPSQDFALTEAQVRKIVARADDSYEVVFVALRDVPIPVIVTASVAAVHDPGDIAAQIRAALLADYGPTSIAATQGMRNFRLQQVNALLKERVPALQDQISDFSVVMGATPAPLPEDYRYFSAASITVNVQRITDTTGLWSL